MLFKVFDRKSLKLILKDSSSVAIANASSDVGTSTQLSWNAFELYGRGGKARLAARATLGAVLES